ncbi:MAG: diheme cytochrome c-553, partial [Chitinophagaceae bacterium]
MKKNLLIISAVITSIFIVVSCSTTQPDKQALTEITKDSLERRGEYLVAMMGCNDCHTPMKMTPQGPAKDLDRMLSGHPAEMPVFPFDTSTTKNWVLFNMSGTA